MFLVRLPTTARNKVAKAIKVPVNKVIIFVESFGRFLKVFSLKNEGVFWGNVTVTTKSIRAFLRHKF